MEQIFYINHHLIYYTVVMEKKDQDFTIFSKILKDDKDFRRD